MIGSMVSRAVASLAAVTLVSAFGAAPGLTAQGEIQQHLAAMKQAITANKQALAQYTWQEQQVVSVKGEEKQEKLYQVQIGPDGKPQKTLLSQQQASSGQAGGGPMMQSIVAQKKEEFQAYAQQVAALAQSYAQPQPGKLQQLHNQGRLSFSIIGAEQVQLVATDYLKAGDTVTITLDDVQNTIQRIQVASFLSDPQDAVDIAVQFAAIPGGPNHVSTMTIHGVSKQLVITTTNSAYQRLVPMAAAPPPDPGWPRVLTRQGATLVTYQPQVDNWQSFTDLTWRMAFSITPAGGKPALGVLFMEGHTDVDNDNKMVQITDLRILKTTFPALSPDSAATMAQLVAGFLPPSVSISLHRVVASVPKPDSVPSVPVRNDPPRIFVSYRPAILLSVEGEPIYQEITGSGMEFVVNTTWPLFRDAATTRLYLLVGQQWLTAASLDGAWSATTSLPAGMKAVAADSQWSQLGTVVPAKPSGTAPPTVFYSTVPSVVMLFDGSPVFQPVTGTALAYATNTRNFVFLYDQTRTYYVLTAGRWFSAKSLDGPWTYATPDLPPVFAQIPPNSPVGEVLASVPGTEQAKDAILLAQVPTTIVVNPETAAAQVNVVYGGPPQFAPIEGTSLSYATNTQDKVIRDESEYYLCYQGVWFVAATPQGPWQTATMIPAAIYQIPPSSPVYNVTYVTQTTTSDGNVQASYTAGYMGAFVVGMVVASGTGYYYPPYVYHPPYGYPYYYPHPATYGATPYYNTATGAYGYSKTAYGPYGSASGAAQYNPYTGTYARGASVSTPYGSRSAAQAYNPYTGAYGATRQGSSPTAQWGASTVSKDGESAYSSHYTTAQGTVGQVQTSSGGQAYGKSTASGTTTAAKTSSGDMYATHDGNVYKNTGSGWQSYNGNGSWSSASNEANQQHAQEGAQQAAQRSGGESFGGSSEMQGMQQESMNRQRGAQTSQQFQRSGGGWGGGGGGRRR